MALRTNQQHPDLKCKVKRAFRYDFGKIAEVGKTVTLHFHDAKLLEAAGKLEVVGPAGDDGKK